MLDTLICAEKDGLIDDIGIGEEVDTLMAEGYDTTSIGLVFALLNMSLYAEHQEQCFKEIQEHINGNFDHSYTLYKNNIYTFISRRPKQPEPWPTK